MFSPENYLLPARLKTPNFEVTT